MYYIYHIPGVKIGCTTNIEKRINQQGFTEYELLETHTDIKIASKRERELQNQYGYKVDKILYSTSIYHFNKAKSKIDYSKNGKRLANWGKETGHLQKIQLLGGKVQGKINVENGHLDRMRNKSNFNKKSILGYNRFTNEFIGKWSSLKECAEELTLKVPKISECINGKRKWHKEYTFRYA
jgi:hypothetical protein